MYPRLVVSLFRNETSDMTFHQDLLLCSRGSTDFADGQFSGIEFGWVSSHILALLGWFRNLVACLQ